MLQGSKLIKQMLQRPNLETKALFWTIIINNNTTRAKQKTKTQAKNFELLPRKLCVSLYPKKKKNRTETYTNRWSKSFFYSFFSFFILFFVFSLCRCECEPVSSLRKIIVEDIRNKKNLGTSLVLVGFPVSSFHRAFVSIQFVQRFVRT